MDPPRDIGGGRLTHQSALVLEFQTNALRPVMARPTIRVFISRVPS
jgi:hypothetical protein